MGCQNEAAIYQASFSFYHFTILPFLDLNEAFDTVHHTILLAKLEKYGIRGITGDWFTSYLRNRKQFGTVGGHRSSAKMVTCGIPQGSCLGPLLFIIYLNDFETCLELSKASMYAHMLQ